MALAPDKPSDPDVLGATTEDRPAGPLNVDPALLGSPADDVAAGESEEFIDGFSWKTVIGALFIGFIMMPGAIYLGLIAGQGLGPAAEWVTIILFMEVARRSYQTLRKQDIFLLWYIGSIAGTGAFAAMVQTQYNIHTPIAQALGITKHLPTWVAPAADSPALMMRTFANRDWLPVIGILMFNQIFGRMTAWGLGYVMFRITSDVERLPFPLAPIAADGAMALAESSAQKKGWRWRVFSIGAMIGVGWGIIYILVPTVTGLIFSQPITIITNPFIDYTSNTQKILPAALSALGTDLSQVLLGFVLPLPVVAGTFISAISCSIIANPILQHAGILKTWTPGLDVIQTQIVNSFDFWLCFSIGTSAVVAFIGICSVIRVLMKANREGKKGPKSALLTPPPGRGDLSIWISLAVWAVGTVAYIAMCHYLVHDFPLWILIFFGFVWTPIFSYVSARMAGIAGTSGVAIPYVREASIMLSGSRSTAIWFAPIPINDYGGMAQTFRTVELTKTKFTSIVKVELLMLPVMLFCSFLFWSLIWHLAPIPSAVYPYASKFWPAQAQAGIVWMTANRAGAGNMVLKIYKPHYIIAGGVLAFLAYGIVSMLSLPINFFYGMIAGVTAQPAFIIPMFIGGLLGRYVFQKRYGQENWNAYAPVLVAGYYCGMGLIGMAAVALALLSKSVSALPF